MRDWIKIVEAPIGSWTVDPDLDANEAEMISQFTGYEQEKPHWRSADKKAIRDSETIQRVRHAFRNTDAIFNLYFWQSTDPDYDRTLEHGVADPDWLIQTIGEEAAERVVNVTTPESITILMTNNLSDERYVPIRSPWIVAHRIAHAMIGGGGTDQAHYIRQAFIDFLRTVITQGYGTPWPRNDGSQFASLVEKDYWETYGKIIGQHLGTMRSARNQHFVQATEWTMETFSQYLIVGDIKFNSLPETIHDEEVLNPDPIVRAKLTQETEKFRIRLKKLFSQMLNAAKGQVYVI